MQADEAKVAALESIFGGQDITASVIRTVLSSKDNKFDEAVDSLLNMSNNTDKADPPPAQKEEPRDDDALQDKRQQEKLKTLENMFGSLSQSVICTVLESNKGELVDAVDTLLNMTSKEINPTYSDVNQREIERARQEEELKNYEDFKKLQIALQEEEARQIKEQQQKIEQDARKAAEAAAAEERRRKEALLEQERLLKEYETQKQIQADIVAKERAIKTAEAERKTNESRKQTEQQRERERELEEAQEKLRKAWEEKLKLLSVEEEKVRVLQAKQQAEEEARKLELIAREQACAAQEKRIRKERMAEEARLAERKAQLEAVEAAKVEELARMRREATQREEDRRRIELQQREELEQQLRVEAEAKAFKQRVEEEERAHQRKLEEERLLQERRRKFQEERQEIQRERAKLEALRQERLRLEEEEAQRREAERVRWEAERKLVLEQEEKQRKIQEEQQRREEEARQQRAEEERLRMAEEELIRRIETERIRREEEERRLLEEELRDQALKEEAEKQQAAYEEERNKKSALDLIAASAVFLPPKAEAAADQINVSASASGDTVTTSWDLPEGNATTTNWLGLYPVRALPNTNKYVQFVYTNGAHSGQHVFRGVTPGHYEVRFFATRLYQHTACTPTVRVGPTPTLGAQLQGDHLLVYYTLDPMSTSPTREWLGIYEKTQRRNKKYLSSAYGNAEGQVMMKAPRTPGVYEVRLFAFGAVYNEQAKCEFVVEDNDCVLIDPVAVTAGANVNVSWVMRTVEPTTGDWIGLYKADEANNGHYISCTYTQGASVGSASIAVPKETGVYELRLFAKAKGRYTTFRTSPPLTVV